jgi:hypothetical protein
VQRGFELSIPRGSLPSVPLVARSGGDLRARASDQGFLPIDTQEYMMLLDWTGREIRENKRGAIPDNLAPILDRLGLDRSHRVNTVREFGRMFKQAAGRASSLARAAPRRSRRWFQGGSLGPFRGMIAPMSQAHAAKTIDGLLDPLSRCLDDESARRVAEFRIDPSIQARVDLLAERANEGLLTDQEGAEYEAFINTADFVSILKLKARRHLTSNGG